VTGVVRGAVPGRERILGSARAQNRPEDSGSPPGARGATAVLLGSALAAERVHLRRIRAGVPGAGVRAGVAEATAGVGPITGAGVRARVSALTGPRVTSSRISCAGVRCSRVTAARVRGTGQLPPTAVVSRSNASVRALIRSSRCAVAVRTRSSSARSVSSLSSASMTVSVGPGTTGAGNGAGQQPPTRLTCADAVGVRGAGQLSGRPDTFSAPVRTFRPHNAEPPPVVNRRWHAVVVSEQQTQPLMACHSEQEQHPGQPQPG
jgi:hypothetical protein